MTTTDPKTCRAMVQTGTSTYAMRNSARRCANPARENGYCHRHQPVELTPADAATMAELRRHLAGGAS